MNVFDRISGFCVVDAVDTDELAVVLAVVESEEDAVVESDDESELDRDEDAVVLAVVLAVEDREELAVVLAVDDKLLDAVVDSVDEIDELALVDCEVVDAGSLRGVVINWFGVIPTDSCEALLFLHTRMQ